MRQTQVYGAWFWESHGVPWTEKTGVPARGWTLVQLIPGKYESFDEIKSKIDAVLEVNPSCDIIALGAGTSMHVITAREYKQKYWPKLKNFEEHIT